MYSSNNASRVIMLLKLVTSVAMFLSTVTNTNALTFLYYAG